MLSLKNLRNSSFKLVILLLLGLGIIFRLGNLELKPYWEDEVYTSMRISGYDSDLLKKEVNNNLIQVKSLSQYLEVNSGRSWLDTSNALINKPEHTPLYFLLARAWAKLFGSSIGSIRAFSALVSLFALPLFYWLALLLFDSVNIARTTLCLACVSPILIHYAQEARPYSLWIVCILLSSTILLKALHFDTRRSWNYYSATVTLTFLTHLLSGFVFLVHGLYVLIVLRFSNSTSKAIVSKKTSDSLAFSHNRLNKQKLNNYFTSLAWGLLPLLPWSILLLSRLSSVQKATHWVNEELTSKEIIVKWGENIIRLFSALLPLKETQLFLVALLLVILLLWSLFSIISKNHLRSWLLPTLMCILPFGILMISDLLLGGQRSTVFRYLLPSYIGALFIFGFGLSFNSIDSYKNSQNYAFVKSVIFSAVLIVAISTSYFNLQSPLWWGKQSSLELSAARSIISTPSPALVISDERFGDFMAFAFSLRLKDSILWFKSDRDFNEDYIFDNFNYTFLWRPSESLLVKAKSIGKRKKLTVKPLISHELFQIQTDRSSVYSPKI
ncbi:MAG: glycosyltransferase family 39 protein [Xenococcaceae cyanobacterium]